MSTLPNDEFTIHLPHTDGDVLAQDQEYFEIEHDGRRRRIRFHDYAEIFSIPGLYEQIFAEALSCDSPRVVVDLLHDTLTDEHLDPEGLRVVDLGAGNGMVGEELARIGARSIVGLDQLTEAREAAERDRPGVYDAYYALDVTNPGPDEQRALERAAFNCLTCVAALGFGDMPPAVFRAVWNLIEPGGWAAFNIRDQFLESSDRSGFAALLEEMAASGELVERARLRYPHRLGLSGEPLYYIAVVAQKAGPVAG